MAAPATAGPLDALARLRRPAPGAEAVERCDMCAEVIAAGHTHVVDTRQRSLVCTCRACYLLFTARGASGGHYRAVPERYQTVTDFQLAPEAWESLQIPVGVAFFFRNSAIGSTAAFFPSPAGATECLLPLDAWAEVESANPILGCLEPDVEAALIRTPGRGAQDEIECFIVPIDSCYELVGRLRSLWRGFDGGREVHEAMDQYFTRLRERGQPVTRNQVDG